MEKKLEKQLKDNKLFYENFLKFTIFTTIAIIILLALLTIFLV
jgi:Bacterial aa3 type cytochrome c oxidase subunit IV.